MMEVPRWRSRLLPRSASVRAPNVGDAFASEAGSVVDGEESFLRISKDNLMAASFRTLAAGCAAIMATTGAMTQGVAGDAVPDITTKMKAVQVYLEDGSAIMVARACTETMPDFMSEFLPKFTGWRTENAKLIALGATLSAQFKDPKGEPMDPAVVGQAAAEQVRAMAPDERSRRCNEVLREVSTGG